MAGWLHEQSATAHGQSRKTDPAANPATAVWESVLRYAPSFLEIDRAVSRQPGFQCAVGVDGELLGAFSGGYAHLGQSAKLTNEHLFRVASHSKTFTATAAMLLCEDGALSLEDRLGDLLPALADSDVSGVRVRELLSHSGGIIRDSENADFWALGRPFPPEAELLEIAKSSKVLERNEHFKYTNIGYGLLGLVIEAVSGQGYDEFVNLRILAPLGLENTGVDLDGRAPELAAGYGPLVLAGRDHALDARTEIEHIHTGALAAATGFYSTASDMVAYFSSHLVGAAPSVLSDDSKRLMQRKVEDSGVAGRGYGLGLILQKVQDRDTFGHSGGYPGHITRILGCPRNRRGAQRAQQRGGWRGNRLGRKALCPGRARRTENTRVLQRRRTGHPGSVHGPLCSPVGFAGRRGIGRQAVPARARGSG